MASDGWVPEIVVGVDFGMTCTGVAYSMGPDWAEPKTLQHWPGKMINELANKVPTLLQYKENTREVKAWGFLCDEESEDTDILACFKLHLDPAYEDPRTDAPVPTLEEARKWFQDYMRCLHDHIEEYLSNAFPRWKTQRTEFVFSVPTTWKSASMIAETERLIKGAGYGSDGANHRVGIGLTEAEAAAVYASKQQFEKDDVILVCDAGGGTTDVNVLQLTSLRGQPTQLQQLSWVEGRSIGSALIDINFHHIVSDRLNKIRDFLQGEPDDIAYKMMQGRFERFKCSYGTPASSTIPTIPLEVPGLRPGTHFSNVNIEDSTMKITREELKKLFDSQIDRMLSLINEQFDRMQKKLPRTQSYLVLSGGLGSSPYVRQRFKSYYETGEGSERPNAQETKIVVVAEPQLAVVQGLVMDRIQTIGRGNMIFKERCCRVSYGVRCREEYHPDKNKSHVGQKVVLDARDGKRYVENQIDWFVKQGENVPSDGFSKPYWLKIKPGQEDASWKTNIIMSTEPRERLPTSLDQDGAKIICGVESMLKDKGVDMKLKNRHWYSKGERYLRVRFDIRVILGAADLKFQLQSKNQVVLNNDYDAIQVRWDPPQRSPKEEGDDMAMYREV
ncbi:hypothetical protein IMSHALPRED_003147 [Imshaugia aleurites]|uniref:Uncharacterized protein n=1 Tax=Imshaugia aleurites TaxID=172621 RepID=A0A8H3J727_9LECA|nr:hypothetical protein IMSHALPRED_003147 [Imshaugia aleurites]